MQEQPDNDAAQEGLDRLFRKSAEEFEPPYEPAAWPIMRAKLDERDRIMVWGWVLRWSLAVMALIVLLSGGWYSYKQLGTKTEPVVAIQTLPTAETRSTGYTQLKKSKTADKQRISTDSQTVESENSESDKVVLQPHKNIAGRQTDYQPMQIETSQRRRLSWPVVRQPSSADREKRVRKTNGRSDWVASDRVASKQDVSDRVAPNRASSEGQPLANKVATRRAGQHRVITGNTDTGNTGTTGNTTLSTTYSADAIGSDSVTASNEHYRIGPVDALGSRGAMHWPKWSTLVAPALSLLAPEATVAKTATPPRERGLSIRVAVAPDLSAIGLKNFAKPGMNYGLLVEYRFNKRFSAQAGFFQSNKVYKATPDQYEWPTRWAGWKVKPIGVQGTCDMYDIPINLRYDLVFRPLSDGRSPSRWFVSSGITTYIMKKEKYDYSYENPEDPLIKVRSWSTKTGRYNFSNLNLSVGYERPINRRFSWQVEPFMKVPLKQVGYFKINLLSTGAFLSLRYRL